MMNDTMVKRDRMRFTKNTASSRLAILAIVFNVLYFVSIYKSDVGTYYYNILIGASILYNLVFMLATFLSSEGVKNYKAGYSWVLAVLGVIQIVRIFILPTQAHTALVTVNGVEDVVMKDGQYIRLIVYLVASAACLFAAAAVNLVKSRALAAHNASLSETKA